MFYLDNSKCVMKCIIIIKLRVNERGGHDEVRGEVEGLSDMAKIANVIVPGTGKGDLFENREGRVEDEARIFGSSS